ncbi:MAG: hypothetical protein DRJ30_03715 [Candidatus Methanomethylicota archaeon]|nr:MAG: hypothetical protein DRJ30_03715 [Candidatus Verstraetearchaeota archaeon]
MIACSNRRFAMNIPALVKPTLIFLFSLEPAVISPRSLKTLRFHLIVETGMLSFWEILMVIEERVWLKSL